MESLVFYLITAVVALIGLGLAGMLLFGLRNIIWGKIKPLSIIMLVFPFVIMAGIGLATDGDWPYAAVVTVFVMIALAALGLVFSGIKGILGF